jgi:hypothetical protein
MQKNLIDSKKYSTFAPNLVFGVRELRTFLRDVLNLSGYERARFGHIIKEIDVKRT